MPRPILLQLATNSGAYLNQYRSIAPFSIEAKVRMKEGKAGCASGGMCVGVAKKYAHALHTA